MQSHRLKQSNLLFYPSGWKVPSLSKDEFMLSNDVIFVLSSGLNGPHYFHVCNGAMGWWVKVRRNRMSIKITPDWP